MTDGGSEHKLDQEHVAHRAARDGKEHLPLPYVENDGHGDGDQLRQSVAVLQERYVFQAVYHEHAEDGAGKHSPQILNVFRRRTILAEHQKGQKAGQHGAEGAHGDRDDLLDESH